MIYEVVVYTLDEETWCDSYWTDEESAKKEALEIFNEDYNRERVEQVSVICRTLNIPGKRTNEWAYDRDKLIITYR